MQTGCPDHSSSHATQGLTVNTASRGAHRDVPNNNASPWFLSVTNTRNNCLLKVRISCFSLINIYVQDLSFTVLEHHLIHC